MRTTQILRRLNFWHQCLQTSTRVVSAVEERPYRPTQRRCRQLTSAKTNGVVCCFTSNQKMYTTRPFHHNSLPKMAQPVPKDMLGHRTTPRCTSVDVYIWNKDRLYTYFMCSEGFERKTEGIRTSSETPRKQFGKLSTLNLTFSGLPEFQFAECSCVD